MHYALIGSETVPGLFNFAVDKAGFFQGVFTFADPQMAGIEHDSGWLMPISV